MLARSWVENNSPIPFSLTLTLTLRLSSSFLRYLACVPVPDSDSVPVPLPVPVPVYLLPLSYPVLFPASIHCLLYYTTPRKITPSLPL